MVCPWRLRILCAWRCQNRHRSYVLKSPFSKRYFTIANSYSLYSLPGCVSHRWWVLHCGIAKLHLNQSYTPYIFRKDNSPTLPKFPSCLVRGFLWEVGFACCFPYHHWWPSNAELLHPSSQHTHCLPFKTSLTLKTMSFPCMWVDWCAPSMPCCRYGHWPTDLMTLVSFIFAFSHPAELYWEGARRACLRQRERSPRHSKKTTVLLCRSDGLTNFARDLNRTRNTLDGASGF